MQRLNEWLSTLLQVRRAYCSVCMQQAAPVWGLLLGHAGTPSIQRCSRDTVEYSWSLPTTWLMLQRAATSAAACCSALLQEKGADIYRSKGILNIAGTDDK